MLFDRIKRTYRGPPLYSETDFDYLNRSARKYCGRIRSLLENWLGHYPVDKREELINRFQSSDENEFQSAFFELYLHELLLRLGFNIKIHPSMAGKSTHPDFLAYLNKKPLFYLEAALVLGAKEKLKEKKRKDIVYDSINKLRSPNFFIGVNVIASSKASPPGRKWRKVLERELSKLDPNKVETELKRGSDKLPEWTIRECEWIVTFYAIPKSKEERRIDDIYPIGATGIEMQWIKDHINIRNTMTNKASKYGRPKLPIIIAVNVLSIFCDERHITDALFGEKKLIQIRQPKGSKFFESRKYSNGVWIRSGKPQNKRISGALMSIYLSPMNITTQTPVLWHNPWTNHPLDERIWPFPQMYLNIKSDRFEPIEGISVGKVLNLPDNWPIKENNGQ